MAINFKVIVVLAKAKAKVRKVIMATIKEVPIKVVPIKVAPIKAVLIKAVILMVIEATLTEAVTLKVKVVTLKVAHVKLATPEEALILKIALRLLKVTLEAKAKVECLLKSQSSCFERLFIDFYQFPQCPFS